MKLHFISTLTEPLSGFAGIDPRKSDLLRGTVVLVVRDEAEGDRRLDTLWDRFCGIVVFPSALPRLEKRGALSWKLGVPEAELPLMRPALEGFATAVELARDAQTDSRAADREIARINLVHTTVREHYNLVTEELRININRVNELNDSLNHQIALLKEAEASIRQHERIDALGQLAGGVAHDFNNILAGIMGFAELLRQQLPPADRENTALVDSILTAAERAAGLTRQLLAFARKQVAEMRHVNINAVIEDVIKLAAHTFDRRIEIRTALAPGPATVWGDASLLQMMLLNLLINARDAMPEGGRLEISSRIEDTAEVMLPEIDRTATHQLLIDVSDTGIGIAPENIKRIFEPFFTTKAPGKGTGLGLAALYGIMRDHGGMVTVKSEPGAGTTFTLCLPLASDNPAECAPPVAARAGGRILAVDDEENLRRILVTGLGKLGFTVETAKDGRQALAMLAEKPGTYDLVILDLNMPVMDGRETLTRMRASGFALPVIIASGYATDPGEMKEIGANAVLPKPYRIGQLAEFIRELLPPGTETPGQADSSPS